MKAPTFTTETDCCTWVDLLRSRALSSPNRRAYTFLIDGDEREVHSTYRQLDQRARAIASRLQSLGAEGERVVLLYPAGLEYIAAFLGCLYAGAVAVPLYPPRPNRGLQRIEAVLADAQAMFLMTDASVQLRLERLSGSRAPLAALQWLVTDEIDETHADLWVPPAVDGDTLAFLQYTSGSTAQPKGVMVCHRHLLDNTRTIQQAFEQTEDSVLVGWLPLFHDMGLIGVVLQALFLGAPCILMAPEAFLMKPVRWLRAISRYRAHTSGGPNFAYDYCARKITPDQRAELDLSHWQVAFNGAEPVRAATLESFADAFEPCGFRREAFYPCYGLAEATLFVSGGSRAAAPNCTTFDAQALAEGRALAAAPASNDTRTLVGCGRAWNDQEAVVVDPQSLRRCAPGRIGEIWVSGPSVALGYWNRPEETMAVFCARLPDEDLGPFLRTGDLGFSLDHDLYITGRFKDLLIIGGRNHHPEDIEQTVEHCDPAVRPGCCSAFSVEYDGVERLVVAAEVDRRYRPRVDANRNGSAAQGAQPLEPETVARNIRWAVAQHHDLRVQDVLLLRHASIPKTSSGKIQRYACRDQYLHGQLQVIGSYHVDESHPQ